MISLKQVSKSFGDVTAVNKVSLEVPAAGSLVILGPSGSGKTTLLRLIAGLEIPDEGEIYIDGKLASKSGWVKEPHLRGLGFVFQSSALWPHMTVAQNIMFGLYGSPSTEARRRLHELLQDMSLTELEHRYPHQISGGEARRVTLARTLAPKPKVLLLDEPLTNLDTDLKQNILTVFKRAVTQFQATIIYVTHDYKEAETISDHILIMNNGCLEVPTGKKDKAEK